MTDETTCEKCSELATTSVTGKVGETIETHDFCLKHLIEWIVEKNINPNRRE